MNASISDLAAVSPSRALNRQMLKRLKDAATVIAEQARTNAGFSKRIPAAISVHATAADGVFILADGSKARNAAPYEYGDRHPTFGHDPWVQTPHKPFLEDAADMKGNAAADKFSAIIDDWARELGFH